MASRKQKNNCRFFKTQKSKNGCRSSVCQQERRYDKTEETFCNKIETACNSKVLLSKTILRQRHLEPTSFRLNRFFHLFDEKDQKMLSKHFEFLDEQNIKISKLLLLIYFMLSETITRLGNYRKLLLAK